MVLYETNLPNRIHRGKVRDTYDLGDGYLLMVATDRISAFDVVFPNGIPNKGFVLSKLSGFWFHKTAHIVQNHYVGAGDDPQIIDRYKLLKTFPGLYNTVARQSMVVRRAQRLDVECIVRGYVAGSAWAEYRKNRTVFGTPMPEGILEAQKLETPIFTPTTKEEEGHDRNMKTGELRDLVGADLMEQLEKTSLDVYEFANQYALSKGIILADTKMEFGLLDGELILIDELLTPDSSRFWDAKTYIPGSSPPNFDKQFVRDGLLAQGWNQEPPAPALSEDVIMKTSERYMEAYSRLTGQNLQEG